jgi:hypothetical protein
MPCAPNTDRAEIRTLTFTALTYFVVMTNYKLDLCERQRCSCTPIDLKSTIAELYSPYRKSIASSKISPRMPKIKQSFTPIPPNRFERQDFSIQNTDST